MSSPFDWTYTIRYNGARSAMVGSRPDLASALAAAYLEASYYLLACGYPDVTIELAQECETCYGNGRVAAKRPGTTKRCPDCHGKTLASLPEFPARLHENVVESAAACLI